MDNTRNSVSSKGTFTSTVLAKAKLLDVSASSSSSSTTSNISEVPTFHTPTIILPEVTDATRAALSRLSASVCQKMLLAERGQELLTKADKYNIPYNKENSIDWLQLIDDVDRYEALLAEATDWCIDWDESEYDPVALEQEIEERQEESHAENNELYSYFSSTLGLEA